MITTSDLKRITAQPGYAVDSEYPAFPVEVETYAASSTNTAVSTPADNDKERATRLLLDQLRLIGLPEPVREYRFNPDRKWRSDLAWPALRLLVEIHGGVWTNGRHNRGKGFTEDRHKMNTAVLLGYRVLEFTTGMVDDETAVAAINQAIGVA